MLTINGCSFLDISISIQLAHSDHCHYIPPHPSNKYNMKMQPTSSSIIILPIELLQLILSYLPDITSLQAAVSSHPAFYDAFRMGRSMVVTEILTRLVTVELLPEAVAVFEAWCRWPCTREDCREVMDRFVEMHKNKEKSRGFLVVPAPLSLYEASAFQRVHQDVSFFAERFALSALDALQQLSTSSSTTTAVWQPAPVSPLEWRRIQRAFYRFHLYCLLCRQLDLDYQREGPAASAAAERSLLPCQVEYFVQRFSPCEREQIACVCDFLFEVLEERTYCTYST